MYKKKKQAMGASGFTLLEMVIVMAMIGILSGVSFKLIKFSDTHRSLSIATAEVKGAVRTAQELALAPPIIMDGSERRVICGFGVRNGSGISNDSLQIYYSYSTAGEVKDCRGIIDVSGTCGGNNNCKKYELKEFEGFTLSQSGDVNVFFRSPYGRVFGEGEITITQIGNGYSKKIEINKYGKINIQ